MKNKHLFSKTLMASALGALLFFNIASPESSLANNQTVETSTVQTPQTHSNTFLDFRKESIYFLFLDRFNDGDADNNTGNNPETYDPNNFKKYMGGDIRGVIDKLPYLKQMGITSIWVTPVVDNADKLDQYGGAAYHGYWGKDFFKVDEHLGSIEDFQELTALMHSPEYNMKLVLDFAPNHSNANNENEYGALYRDGLFITDYPTDVASGSNWYHHNGGVTDWNNWYQVRNHNLFNLSDFNQSNPAVYNYINDATKFWVDMGVDAIRIDAIKHMDKSFIQNWTTDTQNYAKSIGRDGFYFFGEWFGANAWAASGIDSYAIDYANTSGSALLDFGFRDTMERILADRPDWTMRTLNHYLEDRAKSFTSDEWQVVFLDNHDMARISTTLRSGASSFGPSNNEKGGSFSKSYAADRLDLGLVITMTVRGIPAIYYGTEHYAANFTTNAFGQVGSDPYNREMMPGFATNTKAFQIIQALSTLRKNSPAIQRGTYRERYLSDDALVYERKSGSDVVVVATNKGAGRTLNINNLDMPDGRYDNLIGSTSLYVSNGKASIYLGRNDAFVFHKSGTGGNNEDVKVSFTCYDGYTSPGQSVYAVGSIQTLGSWAPAGAVRLSPDNYPTWSASITVPNNTNIEWKCIKKYENNPNHVIQWESGGNNTLNSVSVNQSFGYL